MKLVPTEEAVTDGFYLKLSKVLTISISERDAEAIHYMQNVDTDLELNQDVIYDGYYYNLGHVQLYKIEDGVHYKVT